MYQGKLDVKPQLISRLLDTVKQMNHKMLFMRWTEKMLAFISWWCQKRDLEDEAVKLIEALIRVGSGYVGSRRKQVLRSLVFGFWF